MIPSDEDLDYLLKSWIAPQCPVSLERRVRSAYRNRATRDLSNTRKVWTRWIGGLMPAPGLLAGIVAGSVVCFLLIAQAFPQSLAALSGSTFPFTVDSEEIEYKADGSSQIIELVTSAGGLVLSSEFPGDPVRTAYQRIVDPLNLLLYRMATPIRDRQVARAEARIEALMANHPEQLAKLRAGPKTCTFGTPWAIVGSQTILNHATTGVQKEWMEEGKPVRFTEWMAPDLHCFTLKSTTEKTFDDGTLRLAFEQRALKVTMNGSSTKPTPEK